MVGHNVNEVSFEGTIVLSHTHTLIDSNKQGLLFTSPFIQNDTAFEKQVTTLAPTVKAYPETLQYITDTLYPPIFDGTQAQEYTTQVARAAAQISEMVFTCNTFYLDKALRNNTYSYYFAVPPAIHGSDIPYTYYNGPDPLMVVSPKTAVQLQKYNHELCREGRSKWAGSAAVPNIWD